MNEDCFNIQHMIDKAARASVGGYVTSHTRCSVGLDINMHLSHLWNVCQIY